MNPWSKSQIAVQAIEEQSGGGGKKMSKLGFAPPPAPLYMAIVRAGWSGVRPDHPDLTRRFGAERAG